MLTQISELRPVKPFAFNPPMPHSLGQWWMPRLAPAMERMFCLDTLNAIYARCTRKGEEKLFFERALEELGISYRLSSADLRRIPAAGPVIVVANHPFGALDGMILAALLNRIRPDAKVMANFLLGRIPDTRDSLLLVDPFGSESAKRENIRPLCQAIRWVQNGGMLAVFPAGEVAHADLRTRCIEERAWSPTIARIVRKSGAAVLPIYFHGRNSAMFQVMGMLHPRVRTAMLPRELLKKRGERIDVRVGSLIPHRKVIDAEENEQIAEFLRQRTLLLSHRPSAASDVSLTNRMSLPMPTVCDAGPRELIANEVTALSPTQMLADAGDMVVYEASAIQIPHVLREIGRLREITYRSTGEGTGKPTDLDRFDSWYTHLFVWHKTAGEIVGAYRLAATDDIVDTRGTAGLYTSTLFKYRAELLDRMGPAVELGRSFIRAEYQRSFAALLLLWKGIGHYVVNRPRCKTLFGPVSISNDYQTASKQVLVQFLKASCSVERLALLTRARHPFCPAGRDRIEQVEKLDPLLKDSDRVDDLVSELEPDGKGMPVLLRQYIKLGAKFFSFNIDPDFNNALDALMVVDLTQTPVKLLQRYLGIQGSASFLKYHGCLAV